MADVTDKVHDFFSKYPKHTYPKGQILVFAGEDPEHIFYVTKGKVRQYDVSYRGDEIVLNLFKPGAFFPMSWAINHTPNPYFFRTEENTEIHVVPPDAAAAFVRDNPDVAFDLLSRIYRGMDGILARMVQLMAGSARNRLIHEIIIESKRFGKADIGDSIKLQVTEKDFAARAGLSRETVSREMQRLKKDRWVAVDGKHVVVLNLPALEAVFE